MSGLVVLFPIFSILLLADPNSMWYLFATSFVILSIFCISFWSLLIRATSYGIQLVLLRSSFWGLYLNSLIISLFMSSISTAYWISDSTLMLSFMLICRVLPCLVFRVAFRLLLSSFTNFHVGRSVPSLCMTYRMASSHALSSALVTSRNATYASFLFCLICFIVFFSLSKWSTVAFPFYPPACASVIFILGVILLFTILSNSLPKLLARVNPLLDHFPFVPFPL